MIRLLENCLYHCDRGKFNALKTKVTQFNVTCNGNNIVQDDIFNVIKNYARQNDIPLEILRYPIKDEDLCACTFLREGRIFVYINTELPLGKQIFAAAHELYHIYCYIEGNDPDFSQRGSILKAATIDDADVEAEDIAANAFAGLFLVSSEALRSQMMIYGIDSKNMKNRDIYTLMDIFAIPYKAMILRLYEEEIFGEKEAAAFLNISANQIEKEIALSGIGRRWQKTTADSFEFGSLEENLEVNNNLGFASVERIAEDKEALKKIKETIAGK